MKMSNKNEYCLVHIRGAFCGSQMPERRFGNPLRCRFAKNRKIVPLESSPPQIESSSIGASL